MEDKQ
jgi:hypothetical protein